MIRIHTGLHSGVGKSHSISGRPRHGLRVSRPIRQPRLGVCAFKDWFSGLVQQHKEVAQPPQPVSQTATIPEQLLPSQSQAQPQAQTAPSKLPPKRDFLEARQVSLFQLFDSSDYKFDIPTYQRPYAWRTKQIYELLQDFKKAYDSRQEYFLGAIVATRAADGADVPYQLIDGQQRLTSLVLLLAFLHGWARHQGNDGLEGRIRRMLYLEADPLELGSNGRYRLRLRDSDDQFFRENILDAFLPQRYRLTGLAAAATTAAGGGDDGSDAADAVGFDGDGDTEVKPLENETWWRLYDNATFLRSQLDKMVSEGLNLQDFAFHVLRNCFVVMMVARDEGASFRIFSTLNGRGMDLSVVDKLKADLLAGDLSPVERSHFADAWAEMESVLGRASFHRVFDHMRELAAVSDPQVRETSVLEYFTRRVDDPSAVKQVGGYLTGRGGVVGGGVEKGRTVLQVALDYGRLLLQLRQASWAPPELAALLAETPTEPAVDKIAGNTSLEQNLAEVSPLGQQKQQQLEAAGNIISAMVIGSVSEEVTAALGPEDENRHLETMHEQHRKWLMDSNAVIVGGGGGSIDDAGMATAVEVTDLVEQHQHQGQEEGSTLMFRFDEPAAATPVATTAADADVGDGGGWAATVTEQHEVAPQCAPAEAAAAALVATPIDVEGFMEKVVGEEQQQTQGTVVNIEPPPSYSLSASFLSASVEQQQQQQQQPPHQDSAVIQLHQHRQELQSDVDEVAGMVTVLEKPVEEAEAGAVAPPAAATEGEEGERQQLHDDDLGLGAQRQAALLAELDTRSRHLNMFADESWLPPLLEFFYQTEDLAARAAFMKGAEALQLLLELQGDPALKAERWGLVSQALLQRPFRPEQVLGALRLSDEERQMFRARLDAKDLYGTTDQRTLRHLLVRCEPPSVCRSLMSPGGLGGLIVERVVPQTAPEGSTWRKTRISSPCDPHSAWPDPWFTAAARTAGTVTAASEGEQPAEAVTAGQDVATSASAVPLSYEVKYWYEVQRLNWHGKLGNLVLLPATTATAASATADYDAKVGLWRQAGVASRLPGFTGPLVDERGRYGRFRFCHDECRQRHADMLEYLINEFEL
ncbi:hypothetical protein VOLCADRAFT_103240 [Volvox carteri f. nagariensis]|uniref:GmrSD restriction endonucleases N-terminal domain-containing protein n=1 Tax=Volvox carteri f. nagariensis TaxID=3068 RepID=D8TKF3_VOLCA|nr:uncharacterized protein VOLCADRAFT_103240 [Volvox carteri f. nagariensis]EFJ52238.1 hypothetical protein VOLCADRAFT_103240 [Volvox carteri f. nagariensis]|eukprot:XP_002947012.1 hypothetical protein VOLCADRAFT_103240 [Volvox carteri f. nagariensis]